MKFPTSAFALAICQPGMERALKAEVGRARPDLRSAWSRPGIVTFRASGGVFRPDESVDAVFARRWACSGGSVASFELLLAHLDTLRPARVHLGPRDQGVPDEIPPARQAAADSDARALSERLAAARPELPQGPGGEDGCLILDVITSPDEPPAIGWHVKADESGPLGRWDYAVPDDLPSRAWRMVVEGLRWSRAPLLPGDRVLEIGAAPGGATRAFAEHGARVLAVDPQPIDPAVRAMSGVTVVQRPIGELRLEDVPDDVRWIASDAGIAPPHVVGAIRRILPRVRGGLRGLLLTLKLNDAAAIAGLPAVFAQLEALVGGRARACQLPANRRDVFVYVAIEPSARP